MLVRETFKMSKTLQMANCWPPCYPEIEQADTCIANVRIEPPLLKHINRFARRLIFLTAQSLTKYTTSQRRKFERDIYDYARAIPLSKSQAKIAVIYARRLCGEEEYDSDSSRLDDDEVDDSAPLPTLTEKPWHFSLDWSLAATSDATKLPQISSTSETSNKRPHDDFRGSSEKKRKVNGVMTSRSQGADRPLDSATRKDEGGNHPTEHTGAQEAFSKHPNHTTSGHNSSTEQHVPIPGPPASTDLVSSISQVDTSLTIKDKGQKGHEGAKSSKEGLGGTSSSQDERQRNIEENSSAIEDISSKGFEITKEPFAAARALDELWSQEQKTSSVVKEGRCPKHSNDAHHSDKLASTSHLTSLDQQVSSFTPTRLEAVHAADQSLCDEQRDGEHATAGIEKPGQTGLDLTTSPGSSQVASLSIQHSLLGPGGAQPAEGVQCPEIQSLGNGPGVQTRSGYTINSGQKENQQTPFERYSNITDPWHPPADRSVPSSTQHEILRSSSDPSHNTFRSSPNKESDTRVVHGDHIQATHIVNAESGNGSADGVQREADPFVGEKIGISDANTSHGYSVDADDEKSGGVQADHSEKAVQDMLLLDSEASQTELDDGLGQENEEPEDEQVDTESDEADSLVAAWIQQTKPERHKDEGFAGSTKESIPPNHDEEDPKADRLRCSHCKNKFANKDRLFQHLLRKHPSSLKEETRRRFRGRYGPLDEGSSAKPEMTLESSMVRKSDGPLIDSLNHQNAMVQ